jgi:hypothetical protein
MQLWQFFDISAVVRVPQDLLPYSRGEEACDAEILDARKEQINDRIDDI